MGSQTDSRIFEPEWIGSDERGWEKADYRSFLPNAATQADIVLKRGAFGAIANIPQRFVVHSPTGFEWGYGGSGPADLALNILGLFVAPPEAWRLHQRYKFSVIGGLSREAETIVIKPVEVMDWLMDVWAEERRESVA